MKNGILALAIAVCAATTLPAWAQAPQAKAAVDDKADKAAPRFEFTGGDVHDFGTVTDEQNAEYTFRYKNTGKSPLIIENANEPGGSITPDWNKEPVMPGKTGYISISFYTAGKNGPFNKTVFIKSNAPSNVAGDRYEIHIKGAVTPGAQTGSNVAAPVKG